jgi:CheY-like chemotaxis protein
VLQTDATEAFGKLVQTLETFIESSTMSSSPFPFAVRLIGFTAEEAKIFEATFATEQAKGYGYFRLADDNLQDPDLYVANGSELKALVKLADLRPSDVRPALLVGRPQVELSYPYVERPIVWGALFEALDALIEKRADALSRLEASDVISVPERRRRDRVDLDLTDPSEYERMRATVSSKGMVLVVDKNPAFRNFLSELLMRFQISIEWAGDEAKAVDLCRQHPTAVVMINTSTPGVDPYRLCWAIKEKEAPAKIAVIFLVGKAFNYDSAYARSVGAEGFLNKPLSSHHMLSVLKKFMTLSR